MSHGPIACRSCASTALLPLTGLESWTYCSACSLVQQPLPAGSSQADAGFSSSSGDVAQHAASLSQRLIEMRRLGREHLVIEAGSNDAYLLRHYRDAGVPVLGIDPSRGAAKVARQQHGILTREMCFSRALADRLHMQGLRCDVFHAHDVLGRITDLNGFVHGVRRVLKDDGLAVLETPYIKNWLDGGGPPAHQSEPISLFSLTALCHCTIGQGLIVTEAELTPLHGGSLRVFAVPARPGVWPSECVVDLLAAEDAWGVRSYETYAVVARRAVA